MGNTQVIEIWRYPVKSMLGESVDEVGIGPDGVDGDRRWAVVDRETGVSLSAKRYPVLLQCSARISGERVLVTLPDGSESPVDSPALAEALSGLLDRQVAMRAADTIETIRHEFPTAVTEGEGDPFLYESKTKAFVDCAPLQLLTTATLAELRRLQPESAIDRARFRPNFVVESPGNGFVENGWVGKDLKLGSTTCRVYDHTRRCIMVAHEQKGYPRDMNIIRTIIRENESRVGIALNTGKTGAVRTGDSVSLAD